VPSRLFSLLGRAGVLLSLLFSIEMPLLAVPPSKGAVGTDGPDAEVKEFRLDELEATLRTMNPGPERDYFAGVLANRTGRTKDSIRLLNGALSSIRESQAARAAVALEALADDYNKSFRYDDAARTYDDLLTHFAGQLDSEQLQGTRDDAGVMRLLRGAPAQTIAWKGPTRLKTERNVLGSVITELTVNGIKEKWLLDTGANLSVVSRSFARQLGLKTLPGFGQTMGGVTGIENPLQVAMLPMLQMGGATLQNVVVLVLDDSNLKIGMGAQAYQINAIVGYPVFEALGAITFQHDGWFEAGDAIRHSATSTRMYMKLLMPVIECGVGGKDLPFSFDTGASGTNLSIRYFERFRGEVGSWKKGENKSFGAGGLMERAIYLQPKLDLAVGGRIATLKNVPIFTVKMGSDIDGLYGNVGQDMVSRFDSFTLDFSKMTFSLGAPLPPQGRQ
jgi:predicted aspartyl protease